MGIMKYWKTWAKAAGIRAVKTVAEAALSMLTVGYFGILEVDWLSVASASLLAGVISLLTSIKGLPELDDTVQGKHVKEE